MKKHTFIYILLLSFIIADDVDVLNLKNGDIIKGKIIENKINEYIRIELQGGSILTYKYDDIVSIEREQVSTGTFGSNANNNEIPVQTTPTINCFQDGYNSGQTVSGGGAMAGGVCSGFLLGLIGWGIAFAVVASGNPQPEHFEMQSLDESCQYQYRDGYKKGALKVKKTNVSIGGALGTLMAVILVTSSS